MKYFFISILLFSNFLISKEFNLSSSRNIVPERILFIGNSYLYYNDSLHNHVRRILEESYNKKIDTSNYKLVTISGSRSWHHNIDHPLNHKKIGAKKPFELVILQGGSGETDTKKERDIFAKEVKKNITKIRKSGAEAALYMIHAYVPPHKQTNPQMIKDIKQMYIEAGNKNNVLVIPVGIAFEKAYKANPKIELHKFFDGSHPSLLGTYLASCVVYSSITQRSPVGIKYDYFGQIDKADIDFLQSIAHDTVEEFFGISL
ncbi:MAG: DUF4886 domain-containing protein [Candidatus Neomarinimicrobiota bacterium]